MIYRFLFTKSSASIPSLMKEKEFIEILHQASRETGYTLNGDDAACVPASTVLSTDQFLEGTHFQWHHMTARQLGHKAIVQALSDMAAMGAAPTAVLTSLAWAPKHAADIRDFITGIKDACLLYKVPLVGGDITSSQTLFYADITVAGHTSQPLLKKSAKPGDLIVITGTVGDAAAGLELLENSPALQERYGTLIARYREPQAQLDLILKLRERTTLHAATDISDSLSKSLLQIAEHSHVGFIIDGDSIPVSPALRAYTAAVQKDLKNYVWNCGEDYQLLLTLPETTENSLLQDHGLTVIGRVTADGTRAVRYGDKTSPLNEVGWDPFAL